MVLRLLAQQFSPNFSSSFHMKTSKLELAALGVPLTFCPAVVTPVLVPCSPGDLLMGKKLVQRSLYISFWFVGLMVLSVLSYAKQNFGSSWSAKLLVPLGYLSNVTLNSQDRFA